MALAGDQFAAAVMDHSERKPSYFRSNIHSEGSNGAGLRDNGMGWNAMLKALSGRIAKGGRMPVSDSCKAIVSPVYSMNLTDAGNCLG